MILIAQSSAVYGISMSIMQKKNAKQISIVFIEKRPYSQDGGYIIPGLAVLDSVKTAFLKTCETNGKFNNPNNKQLISHCKNQKKYSNFIEFSIEDALIHNSNKFVFFFTAFTNWSQTVEVYNEKGDRIFLLDKSDGDNIQTYFDFLRLRRCEYPINFSLLDHMGHVMCRLYGKPSEVSI